MAANLDATRQKRFEQIAFRIKVAPKNGGIVTSRQLRGHFATLVYRPPPLLPLFKQADGGKLKQQANFFGLYVYNVIPLDKWRQDKTAIIESEIGRLANGPRP